MFFALEASDDIPSVTAQSISLSYDLQRGLQGFLCDGLSSNQ